MTNNFYPSNDARLNEARRLLNELSVDDMQKLINNNEEMDRFIEKIPEVQQLESIRENMREKNRRLAERNLEKKPMLDLEKQKLVELHTQLAQLKEQYKRMRGQQDDQNGEMTPDVIYTLLQSAATDLERSSEQMAEDFFYGEKSEEEVTDFERRFIDNRRRAHELKIKAEKFHELMQASQATAGLHQYNRNSGYR